MLSGWYFLISNYVCWREILTPDSKIVVSVLGCVHSSRVLRITNLAQFGDTVSTAEDCQVVWMIFPTSRGSIIVCTG